MNEVLIDGVFGGSMVLIVTEVWLEFVPDASNTSTVYNPPLFTVIA